MNTLETKKNYEFFSQDEISLVDLALVLWKRKWMIVIVTLVFTFTSAGISLMLPKVYEVTAILQPAVNTEGKEVVNPEVIKETILTGAYDRTVSQNLGLEITELPEIKVSVPKGTKIIKIVAESPEPEKASLVVNQILENVSKDIDQKLDLLIQQKEDEIKKLKLQEIFYQENIKLLEKQIIQTEKQTKELNSLRENSLANPRDGAKAVLLYSNAVRNQQIYFNVLQAELTELKNKQEKTKLLINSAIAQMDKIEKSEIRKTPDIPSEPIKPKKLLITAIVFVFGFMGSLFLVFFVEFVSVVRIRQKSAQDS